jgi:hypothetical protein
VADVSFSREFDLHGLECSAGWMSEDDCEATPIAMVGLNGRWLGAACCDDERHIALATQWTLRRFDEYGTRGCKRIDELLARHKEWLAMRTQTETLKGNPWP